MPTLDALRPATADSFDRAAALLRDPRPPRPTRAGRRRVLLAAALVALVGACSYPVETDETVGYVISWTTYGSVSPANYTVKALDRSVPASQRLAVETYAADRPALPPDHDWPESGSWTRLRYAVGTTDAVAVGAWTDSLRALVGAYEVRIEPLVETERRSLGAVAADRIGLTASPADPAVSDAELQAYIDRFGTGDDRQWVARLPDGRRYVTRDGYTAVLLGPGSRLWVHLNEAGQQQLTVYGFGMGNTLLRVDGRWRPWEEAWRDAATTRIDSLARAGSSDPILP